MTTDDRTTDEQTPLLTSVQPSEPVAQPIRGRERRRIALFQFLEAQTGPGKSYERFIIALIFVNVICFILGSLFVPGTAVDDDDTLCRQDLCDALFFGNYVDNGLQFLNIGSTSILELLTVFIFTVEYILRIYTADLLDLTLYGGWTGRIRYIPTFFSLVDLISTVPFYVDAFIFPNTDYDVSTTAYLRMFRLFRMMRVEGRYDTAFTLLDDVLVGQKDILLTAGFVGLTVWMAVSSLYYLTERTNVSMIYCPICTSYDPSTNTTVITTDAFDPTTDCVMDHWGIVNCTREYQDCTDCYHRYESIPMASYYALLNLFGEYPLIDQHSLPGKLVGTLTAVVAVAVFALPVGIIGNGLEMALSKQKRQNAAMMTTDNTTTIDDADVSSLALTPNFEGNRYSLRGRLYNVLHARTVPGATALELFIDLLILATVASFMLDTVVSDTNVRTHLLLDSFEFVSVMVFTLEYAFRLYAIREDPKYADPDGRFRYMCTFLSIVDILSFVPYWLEMLVLGGTIFSTSTKTASSAGGNNFVKSLRLLRILRFERYTHAFSTFDDVFFENIDVLAVTAFSAVVFWIFFSTCLYFTERHSLDEEMAFHYRTIPSAMWITLLNLSGESPLSQYSMYGKIITAILGLFATGIFGIPIGLLGAGFEAIVSQENEDNLQELASPMNEPPCTVSPTDDANRSTSASVSTRTWVQRVYKFVNGLDSIWGQRFELSVYTLILLSVAVGAWQTVDGHENDFHELEWIAVIVFTIEYALRFIGAGADPEFTRGMGSLNWSESFWCRCRFLISFYSLIDLLAIVPFYVALALPNTFVNDYDEYFRMLRIVRLLKLDKYVPSITLIDDVVRLKFSTLRVAFFAAVTLWILFAAALYLCEHTDENNAIDPVPQYGCSDNCTMSDRFQNFFDALVYTGIHLTGDYPIITYSRPARFINFFMVIAAVGVVSVPSGLIASGFVEIVRSKHHKSSQTTSGSDVEYTPENDDIAMDTDWYETRYRDLEGVAPPPSPFGTQVDHWQIAVNEFLNGRKITLNSDEEGRSYQHTHFDGPAFVSRIFIFVVIIANVFAVILESVPRYDKYIGNAPGNLFDRFEMFSVLVFATEYLLRLFCAPKNREALYSSWVYATTFFGIVDFLSTAPWFIEQALISSGSMDSSGDFARIFRIFRIFRILQLEDFIVAFSKLDNVFRASKDVLKATGLMATIVWVGCGALFYIFEENNPNWRSCDSSVPLRSTDPTEPGCYDFSSTKACNEVYPGLCSQSAFIDMPDSLYYTAIFLGGEWGIVDFTWPGRMVCLFLCVVGIGLYSIPIGTLFDSFGKVLGLANEEEDENDVDNTSGENDAKKQS